MSLLDGQGRSLGVSGRLDWLHWAGIPRPVRSGTLLVFVLLLAALAIVRLWQPELATLFLAATVTFAVYRLTTALTGDPVVQQAVAVGFVLRLGLATALYLVSFHHWPLLEPLQWQRGFWSFAPDSWFWDGMARGFLGHPTDVVDPRLGLPLQPTTWPTFTVPIAAIYWLVGDYVLSAAMVNVALASLTIALGAAVVARLGSRAGARLIAWTLALWPSLLLWSTQLLKDCAVAFLVVLSLYLSLEVVRPQGDRSGWLKRRGAALVGLALTLWSLFVLRDFLAVGWLLALAVLGLVLAIRRLGRLPRPARWTTLTCLLLLCGGLLAVEGPCVVDYHGCRTSTIPGQALTSRTIERIIMFRLGSALEAGSHIALGDIVPVMGSELVAFAPAAVAVALLAPFPPSWFAEGQSTGTLRTVSALEMLALYLVLPWLLAGCWLALRRIGPFGSFLLILTILYALVMGTVVVNEGSLFRVRQSALLVILLLGASSLGPTEAT